MPSFTTIFRAVVMLIAAVFAVKGWQHFGPSTAQLKSLAARCLVLAQEALDPPAEQNASTPEPAKAQPQGAPNSSALASGELVAPPIIALPAKSASSGVVAQHGTPSEPTSQPGGLSSAAQAGADRLPALMTRLDEFGATDRQLGPWGTSGQLYRFCCRATSASAPSFARHFEAVAAEPAEAVEEVLAKVAAWRTAELDRSRLR